MFSNVSLRLPFWPMGYVELFCITFTYKEIFQILISSLNPFLLGNVHFMISLLLNVCWLVLWPRIWTWFALAKSHVQFNRTAFCCFGMECFINISSVQLFEKLRFSISLLTLSLLIFLSVAEREVLKSPTTIIYFSFQFNQFLPHIFYSTVIRSIYIYNVMCSWWVESFTIMSCPLFAW